MPIYEYVCEDCRHRFEKLQSMSFSGEVKCPECGESARRAISVFAAVTRSADGEISSITGGGCSSCFGGDCSTCSMD